VLDSFDHKAALFQPYCVRRRIWFRPGANFLQRSGANWLFSGHGQKDRPGVRDRMIASWDEVKTPGRSGALDGVRINAPLRAAPLLSARPEARRWSRWFGWRSGRLPVRRRFGLVAISRIRKSHHDMGRHPVACIQRRNHPRRSVGAVAEWTGAMPLLLPASVR
jgi:hypothetical protein